MASGHADLVPVRQWPHLHEHDAASDKYKNIQKKPRVALFVGDPNDAYRGIEVQGKVNFIRDNLEQWNRRLATRYHPAEEVDETVRYLMSEPRVILDVTPTRVAKIGSSWHKRQSDA